MQVPDIPEGERPHVLITHDESTFNANDGKRFLWVEENKQPLRPKGRGKGIMVSDFLTAGGRLQVPMTIPDEHFEQEQIPQRFASEYLEYGKDNYWTGEKMVSQTIKVALPIFRAAFPGFIGVWAFDNASNHCVFHENALRVDRLNKGPGGKQPIMREGFIHGKGRPQSMQYPDNYHRLELAGKPKGVKQILLERGEWDREYYLECPKTLGRPGCLPEGRCCGRAILAVERDFREQKGLLQEELESRGQKVIFYPKFHCELNPIEPYWCKAKWFTRENCDYTLNGLRSAIPSALASVHSSSINGFFQRSLRTIDAYKDGVRYGTEDFKSRVYKSHRRFEDRSKW